MDHLDDSTVKRKRLAIVRKTLALRPNPNISPQLCLVSFKRSKGLFGIFVKLGLVA